MKTLDENRRGAGAPGYASGLSLSATEAASPRINSPSEFRARQHHNLRPHSIYTFPLRARTLMTSRDVREPRLHGRCLYPVAGRPGLLAATKFTKWSNFASWRAQVRSSAFRVHGAGLKPELQTGRAQRNG